MTPSLTVVIPAFNERQALPGLLDEIEATCASLGSTWEVLVVDDGSTDGTFAVIAERPATAPGYEPYGCGATSARRPLWRWVSPTPMPTESSRSTETARTIQPTFQIFFVNSTPPILCRAGKRRRRDPWPRRAASRLYNRVTGAVSGVSMHDMNCGLKAYRGECARFVGIYGELHRYIPVLAHQLGWRVAEIPVNHRAREFGRSKFGAERYLRGAFDLLTVGFLGRYQNRPLHLFGGIGLFLTVTGVLISIYMTVLRLSGERIGDRPLLFLGVLLIVVGVQVGTSGLIGQMIVQARRERAPADQALVAEVIEDGLSQGGSSRQAAASDFQPTQTSDAEPR